MTQRRSCPRCGIELPKDAPEGQCPTCLAEIAQLDEQRTTEPAGLRDRLAALLPDYEFEEFLGRGGMGAVFAARQRKLDRRVAIKALIPIEDAEGPWGERFEREAQALAKLNHPNVVGVHDFGQVEELSYLVLEYVEGATLRELFVEGPLAPKDALVIVGEICDALQYAHEEGVVHRDVKPENILLDQRGNVKIADFGLAKLVDDKARLATLTGSRQAMGTLRYMAPEQIDTPRLVDHRADIYSLGVVFYEMLTGQVPAGNFESPSEIVDVDPRLDAVVLRALKRAPAKRYQSVSEIKAGLAALGGSLEKAGNRARAAGDELHTSRREQRAELRHRRWSRPELPVLIAVGFMLVLPGALWVSYGAGDPRTTGLPKSLIDHEPYGMFLAAVFVLPLIVLARSRWEELSGVPQLPRLFAPFGVMIVLVAMIQGAGASVQVTPLGRVIFMAIGGLSVLLALFGLARLGIGAALDRRRRQISPAVVDRMRWLGLFFCGLGIIALFLPWVVDLPREGSRPTPPVRGFSLPQAAVTSGLFVAVAAMRMALIGQPTRRFESLISVVFGALAMVIAINAVRQGQPGPGCFLAIIGGGLLAFFGLLEWLLLPAAEER